MEIWTVETVRLGDPLPARTQAHYADETTLAAVVGPIIPGRYDGLRAGIARSTRAMTAQARAERLARRLNEEQAEPIGPW